MILAGNLIAYTQTDPTGSVVTIQGRKYVLVSERSFGQIEKMIKEVPALRDENQALKIKDANSERIIALEREKNELQAKVLTATENALGSAEKAKNAESKRADAEATARIAVEKALAISEADRARLEKKVKKYRTYAVIGGILTTVAGFLLFK